MSVFKFIFKSVDIKGSGSYNTDTGVIKHPPKGQGRVKVKSKVVKGGRTK